MPSSFLVWHRRLWGDHVGDSEAKVISAEGKLCVSLPGLLRDVYLCTALRRSQMIHLCPIDDLLVRDGMLVIAAEQQGCWAWGVPLDHLSDENPELCADLQGTWKQDGCSLLDFLSFYSLMNRPYEP